MSDMTFFLVTAIFTAVLVYAVDRCFGRCKCPDCGTRFYAHTIHKCPTTGRRKICR